MANINVKSKILLSCPSIIVSDDTDYTLLSGTNHSISDMDYSYLELEVFSDKTYKYSSVDGEYDGLISKPGSVNLDYITGKDGVYSCKLVALPKENYILPYEFGDCVRLSTTGKIYKSLVNNNQVLLESDFLVPSNWIEVSIDNVSGKYISVSHESVRCHLLSCMKDIVADAVCSIEANGNNNYLYCKDKRFLRAYESITLFYTLYYGETVITDENKPKINKLFSLLNSFCCY